MNKIKTKHFPEASNSLQDAPQSTRTDKDTDGEDGFSTDSSLDLETQEWEGRKSGCMESEGRKWKYTDSARMFKLRKGLDQLDSFYQQKELNVTLAREELKACQLHVTELEGERDNLETDIEKEKQAENSAVVYRLRARLKCVCAELQTEEELEAHLAMVLQEHELELFQVEIELQKFIALRQELAQEEKDFKAQKQEKYNQRIQREMNITKGAKIKALHTKEQQQKVWQEQAELEQRKQDQAQASRQKAAVFFKQTLKWMHREEQEREEERKALTKRRMEAATELKANILKNQAALQMRQVKEKARLQKQEEEEKCQIQSLEAAGLNNIKLMHQQKAEKNFYRKQEQFREGQKARRMEIFSKLEEEQKERIKKQHDLPFLPSPPHVTRGIMQKQRELRLLKNLLPLSAPTERELVQERCSTHPVSSSDKRDIDSSLDSMQEGIRQDYTWDKVEEGMEEECLVQPEFTGLWDRKQSDYMCLPDEDVPPKASLLRSTKTSPDKTVTSIAVKKPLGGKVQKRPPYVSKPEVILFKDFDLEKSYKEKIVLTNVTNATNKCKFVGLSDNLLDFISVSFVPSVPVSPGMTSELEAVFKPLLNEDLDGELYFQSATGPFSVIVKCRTKKCEMVVDSSFIDFGTHVVGQTISRIITLTNRGALGTRYSLVPLPSSHPQHSDVTLQTIPSKQSTIGSSGMESVAFSHQEEIQSQEVIDGSKSGTSLNTSADTEASSANQISGATELQEHLLTVVEQEPKSEISIDEVHDGEIGPFTSIKMPIVFMPTIPGETQLDVQITFSVPGCEAIVVSARGLAESVPVWVTKPSMDLKICKYDHLYQDTIEIQSRANTVLKVSFDVCKELKNHIDILPKMGFIQAKSSFNAHLKFFPRCSLPEDAKSFFDQDTGVLEVPLSIQVADQVKPVIVTVHAVVTTSDLKFDCTEVDFGHCSVFESVWTSVRITNCSLLPQDFGFVGVPKFIDIQPNDGFNTLLPLQTLELDIIFNATRAGEYKFQLTCLSGVDKHFLLSCHAIGVHPLLELSDSLVQFGATSVGDQSTAVLYVLHSHTSNNELANPVPRTGRGPITPVGPRFFTFIPPENSGVTLAPSTGKVLPGQRCLVHVMFSPVLCKDDIKAEVARLFSHNLEPHLQEPSKAEPQQANFGKSPKPETPSKRKMQQESIKGRKSSSGQNLEKSIRRRSSRGPSVPKTDSCPQSPTVEDIQKSLEEYGAGKASLLRSFKDKLSSYIIPCFVSGEDTAEKKETEEPTDSSYSTLYLELHCPAVRPVLLVVSDNGETTINFKQVVVGQKALKKVTIQNISSEIVMLKSTLMDTNGPFSLLNAMRAIKPGNTHTLKLAFTPAIGKKYQETLRVSCSKMTLELTLCGEGVEPELICSHVGGVIDFGYVLEKDSNHKVFQLHNSSSVIIQFSMLLDSHCLLNHNYTCLLQDLLSASSTLGTQNCSGQSVFCVSPTKGTIAPGKFQDVTVIFQPDHQSLHYRDTLRVQLLMKQTLCVLELRGRAQCHSMFVCGGDQMEGSESLIPSHIYGEGETQPTEGEKPPKPVLLTLRSVYREGRVIAAVRELEVGCIQSSQAPSKKNGEYLWEKAAVLQENGFSVEPTSGSVEPGHKCTLTITWTPPAGHTPNKLIQVCVPLILKGAESQVYHVTLLAYISHHSDSG